MTDTKRRIAPQKLVSFEPSTRGYSQLDKELESGWSVVSIASHGNKFICVLEKTDSSMTIKDVLAMPLSSRKKQLI